MRISPSTLFAIGGFLIAALGVMHLVAHTISPAPVDFALVQGIIAFELAILGNATLLELYNGFSVLMGSLLLGTGLLFLSLGERSFVALTPFAHGIAILIPIATIAISVGRLPHYFPAVGLAAAISLMAALVQQRRR